MAVFWIAASTITLCPDDGSSETYETLVNYKTTQRNSQED
jgi:hypothetical protein